MNAALPMEAEVLARREESPGLFTLQLRLTDPAAQAAYAFRPGQFNMLYLYGVGEVPISIVSDPREETLIEHTIRAVGRVTRGLERLEPGDRLGLRGPFGNGWPLGDCEQRDVVVVTGGLGCAPVTGAIHYLMKRRERFGHVNIVQGVKHSADLIWREQYECWARMPDTTVLIAADEAEPLWPWHVGRVTDLFDRLHFDPAQAIVLSCGPEGMMITVAEQLQAKGIPPERIWLSLERNMQCGIGLCGHCQFGARFVCRDGPVFRWRDVASRLEVRGL